MKISWSFLAFCLWGGCCAVFADDLYLLNGMVYRNYQIKAVNNDKVSILHVKPDGNPDSAELDLNLFPEDLRNKLAPKKKIERKAPRPEKTLQDKLMNMGDQLQFDIENLDGNDSRGRLVLGNKVRRDLNLIIAGMGESAEFSVVQKTDAGVLVKVIGTEKKARLRTGKLLFIYGYVPQIRAFRLTVYPAGDKIDFGKYGVVDVYAGNVADASTAAMDFIGRYIGDNSFIAQSGKADAPHPAPEKRETDSGVFSEEPAAGTTIINNYYIEDDDHDFPVVVVGNGRRPPRKPHTHPKPPPKPHHKPNPPAPSKPHPKPNRGTLGNRPVHPALINRPTVVKNTGHSGNYGVLPKHLAPGTKSVPAGRK